jgi:hypothetical protein
MQTPKDTYHNQETDFNLYYKIVVVVDESYDSEMENVRFFVFDKEQKSFLRSYPTMEQAIDECEQLTIIKESHYFNSI